MNKIGPIFSRGRVMYINYIEDRIMKVVLSIIN